MHGVVQGVFFRASAARQAAHLGVAGFARNQRDGSVLVEVEGQPAAVEAFLAWCQVGPSGARVDQVTVETVPTIGAAGFRTA